MRGGGGGEPAAVAGQGKSGRVARLPRAHAIDLRQDLVDHSVACFGCACAAAPRLGDRIHLIEEYHARRRLPCHDAGG